MPVSVCNVTNDVKDCTTRVFQTLTNQKPTPPPLALIPCLCHAVPFLLFLCLLHFACTLPRPPTPSTLNLYPTYPGTPSRLINTHPPIHPIPFLDSSSLLQPHHYSLPVPVSSIVNLMRLGGATKTEPVLAADPTCPRRRLLASSHGST